MCCLNEYTIAALPLFCLPSQTSITPKRTLEWATNILFLPTAPYFRLQMCVIVDYKYAWDDVKCLNLWNEVWNVPNVLGFGGKTPCPPATSLHGCFYLSENINTGRVPLKTIECLWHVYINAHSFCVDWHVTNWPTHARLCSDQPMAFRPQHDVRVNDSAVFCKCGELRFFLLNYWVAMTAWCLQQP